jgi:C-terminal processing protease CtpA/Prc
MKQIFILFILAIFFSKAQPASAQFKEVQFLIDTCITILKQNSVSSHTVNWEKVKKNALAKAVGITDGYKLGPIMRYIYGSINDFHGAFFYKDSTFKVEHKQTPVSDSVHKEWNKGISIRTQMLENNVGYLRIPYMSTGSREQNNANAQKLNDSLCLLLEKNIKGLVLDLRLNGGGDMHLMILGVQQLLGEGYIGSFHVKKKEDWILKNNSFFADTSEIVSITPKCNVNAQNIPIVVLVGPGTGSSGEFFLMAFKGRQKTIFLGDNTAGYVTVVAGLPVNGAAYMYISVGYGADRNGRIYKEAIKPDILFTSPDSFNDIKNDEKVKAAENWLKLHFN